MDAQRGGSRRSDERGASAVEFAIVLSLLFTILFGTIQFGIAYNRYQGLQAAAREGARVASVGGTQPEIHTRVEQTQSLFFAGDIQVRIDYSADDGKTWPGNQVICDDATGGNKCNQSSAPCNGLVGAMIRVRALVPSSLTKYAIVIPLWGSANINYSSAGVFRCEQSGG